MSGIALKSPDLGEGYYQSKLDSVWKRNGYLGAMVIALPALTPASQPHRYTPRKYLPTECKI
jgi:hypothetical protein